VERTGIVGFLPLYDISVAIHVTAAIVGFGATFTYPVIQIVAEQTNRHALPFAMAAIVAISRWVAVPATVVVGATGFYQLGAGPYGLDDLWLVLGLVLYLIVMGTGIFVLAPAYRRAEEEARRLVEATGPSEPIYLSPEYRASLRPVNVLGPFVSAAIVATAVLMVVKPA
jgi:uncharacterized membrane protein